MTTFTLEEAPEIAEIPLIPEDTEVEAIVRKAEVVTTKMTNDDGSPGFRWSSCSNFRETSTATLTRTETSRQRRVWGQTSTKFSNATNCRLRAWVTEILAVDSLPIGFHLDLNDLVDHPVRAIVTIKTWEDKKAPINPDGTRPMRSMTRSRTCFAASPPLLPVSLLATSWMTTSHFETSSR